MWWVQCCQCRRVRDSRGRWYFEDEAVIASDGDGTVSHGLCPDCGTVAHISVGNRRAKKDLVALKERFEQLLFASQILARNLD